METKFFHFSNVSNIYILDMLIQHSNVVASSLQYAFNDQQIITTTRVATTPALKHEYTFKSSF